MTFMIILITLAIGNITGCLITKSVIFSNRIGTLRIDNSDEDGPYTFLEAKEDVNRIAMRRYVILDVNYSNYLTQE